MCCIVDSTQSTSVIWIFGHIQDAESPKEGWDNMVCFFAVNNTKARKTQLKTELNTLEKRESVC